MTTLSPDEQATLERIEAAEPAPESFDAVAALRRVRKLADDYSDEPGVAWDILNAINGTA